MAGSFTKLQALIWAAVICLCRGQLLYKSLGSCVATSEGENVCLPTATVVPISDCYCDDQCFAYQDCCSDIFLLDHCGNLTGHDCTSGAVRLTGGAHPSQGFVEVCIFQRWRPVCYNWFGLNETKVTCNWLEYDDIYEVIVNNPDKPVPDVDEFYAVNCTGTEYQLNECRLARLESCPILAAVKCVQRGGCFSSCINGICDETTNRCDCEDGWTGYNCTVAVCEPECVHGFCSGPGTCTCFPGWTGATCRSDINECADGRKAGCHQLCNNTLGSYSCECLPSYELSPDGHTCLDVDECDRHLDACDEDGTGIGSCVNTYGSYYCKCVTGYQVLPGEIRCQDIDECSVGNGGCGHDCVNTNGSYKCSCRQGYQLDENNSHLCEDVDECSTDSHACDTESGFQVCVNLVGSHLCECARGYEASPGQSGCQDIDECSEDNGGCSHACTNLPGRFRCSCDRGYQLLADNRTCEDINECTENGTCLDICVNEPGSYSCDCSHGYALNDDGRSCSAMPCRPSLTSPAHGELECPGGQVTGGNCSFACEPGYRLTGEWGALTCLPDGSWSRPPPSCQLLQCREPYHLVPPNGYIQLPCPHDYDSSCQLGCFDGYNLTGSDEAVCTSNNTEEVRWIYAGLEKTACLKISPCKSSPCFRGDCRELSDEAYLCDCTGTFATGDRCEIGDLGIVGPTVLMSGQLYVYEVFAMPDAMVSVRVSLRNHHSEEAVALEDFTVTPDEVTLVAGINQSGAFNVTVSNAGQYDIAFLMTSKGDVPKRASTFPPFFTYAIIVTPVEETEKGYFDRLRIHNRYLVPSTCKANRSLSSGILCSGDRRRNSLISSCGWEDDRTGGIVHVYSEASSLYFPLSASGLYIDQNSHGFSLSILSGSDVECLVCGDLAELHTIPDEYLLGTSYPYTYKLTVADVVEFVSKDSLAFSFVHVVQSSLLPPWVTVAVPNLNRGEPFLTTDVLSRVVSGDDLHRLDGCKFSVASDPDEKYVVLRHSGELSVTVVTAVATETAAFPSPPLGDFYCFAVSLCDMSPAVVVSFPDSSHQIISMLPVLSAMKESGYFFNLTSITIRKSKSLSVSNTTYWNGASSSYVPPSPAVDVETSGRLSAVLGDGGNVSAAIGFAGELSYEYVTESGQAQVAVASGNASLSVRVGVGDGVKTIHFEKQLTEGVLYYRGDDIATPCSSTEMSGIVVRLAYKPRPEQSAMFQRLFQLPYDMMHCDVSVFLGLDSQGEMNGLSFYSSCLELACGSLVFPGMSTRTVIRVDDDDAETHCLTSEGFHGMFPSDTLYMEIHASLSDSLTLSKVFTVHPGSRGNYALSMGFAAHQPPKMAALLPVVEVNLLDSAFNTSLLITDGVLRFEARTSLASFPVHLQGSADTSRNWDSMLLSVDGWFEGPENASLATRLEELVRSEVVRMASESLAREQQAESTRLISSMRLTEVETEVTAAMALVHSSRELYNETANEVSALEEKVYRLEQEVASGNERLLEAQQAVASLCQVEECPVVCRPTIESRVAYDDIFVPINTTCRIRENVTEEVRVPPFFQQKVSWRFIEECLTYTSPCPSATEICRYNRCANLCKSFIEFVPIDNYANVTAERFRDVACTRNVYNETVVRTEYFTDPCGKMIKEPDCLNQSSQCQREIDRAYAMINDEEEDLTLPLQLLSQTRTELVAAQNLLILHDIILSSSKSQLQLLSLIYDSVSLSDQASQETYDRVVDDIATGLWLGKLLSNVTVEEVFSVSNVTFSVATVAEDANPRLLPVTVSVLSAVSADQMNELSIEYLYDLSQSFESQKEDIADIVFERVFGSGSREKRGGAPGRSRPRRQSPGATESDQQVQCAELSVIASFLLYLQYTLADKHQQAIELLHDISELVSKLEEEGEVTPPTSVPANYSLLASGFGIVEDDLRSEPLPPADPVAVEAVVGVIDEIRAQAERVAADVELLEFIQWQGDVGDLQAEAQSVGRRRCFGLADCLLVLSDIVQDLLEDTPPELVRDLLLQLPPAREKFVQLATNSSLTPSLALAHLQPFLSVVLAMKGVGYWCAGPPRITLHPDNVVNVTRGGVLSLECRAESDLPFTYMWRKDGVAVYDSNTPLLTISNVQVADEGNYTCEATNAVGTSTATRSIVHTFFLPLFYLTPVSATTYLGDENGAWFGCNATSRPDPGWVWQYRRFPGDEWELFPGVETNELLIRQPNRSTHEGQYRCVAYNWHGNISSEPVDLKLLKATLRVTAIPIQVQLSAISIGNITKRRRRNAEDIEVAVFGRLGDVLGLDDSLLRGVTIETLEEGDAVSITFLLTSKNLTSANMSETLLEDLLPAILQAERELFQLTEDLQTYLTGKDFLLASDSELGNNTTVTVSTTTILCPAGQELHDNRILCVDCLPGEQPVPIAETRVVGGGVDAQATLEVVPRCRPCPLDTYQDEVGGGECKSCPGGSITLSLGSTNGQDCVEQCRPNHFSPTGLPPCQSCNKGHYQPDFGETECLPCLKEHDDPACEGAIPLAVKLISGSPLVQGSTMTAILDVNKSIYKLRCKVTGRPYQNCASGHVTFADLEWRPKNKYYTFRADAITEHGEQFVLRRKFLPGYHGRCTIHLVNDGVSIKQKMTRLEFAVTGPVSSATCVIDQKTVENCTSPLIFGELDHGVHVFHLRPHGCTKKNTFSLKFSYSLS